MTAEWAPSRHVALDGAVNVRDIGGYRSVHGLEVMRGQLFRGDSLSQLTAADVARLDTLGLRTVIDFRTPGEILLGGADRLPYGVEFVGLPVSPRCRCARRRPGGKIAGGTARVVVVPLV